MANLPADLAYQYSITGFVEIGSLGALLFDILINLNSDYTLLLGSKFTFPTFIYFFSRTSILTYTLLNVILPSAAVGAQCGLFERVICVLFHVACSSSALLFLLRVSAIFANNKYVLASFSALWLGVVGGSLTAAILADGGAAILEPTENCHVKTLESYVSLAPIASITFDTCVFLAISWRLLADGWVEPNRRPSFWDVISGNILAKSFRFLFRDGFLYYSIAVTSNLAVTVIIFLKALPPTYRFMLIFNGVLTNMMTCRVYRNTKLGLSHEENNTWRTTLDSIIQLDGAKEVKGAALASKCRRARTAGLWMVAISMLGFPFLCLYLCKTLKDPRVSLF